MQECSSKKSIYQQQSKVFSRRMWQAKLCSSSMQMLLSQTTKTREKGKEMIEEEKASPNTQLQSGVIMYEAQKILDFLNTGVMILPGTGRSDWNLSTDEQYEYMLRMHKRLSALYDLYRRENLELPLEDSVPAPQGIDNA